MGKQWYYTADGTQQGPVSAEELADLARSGRLKATDLVWKDGMADWVPLGRVKGLSAGGKGPPPPPLTRGARTSAGDPDEAARPGADRAGEAVDWRKLGLWRFGAVYAAVVLTVVVLGICGGLLGMLVPDNAGKPVPWDGLAAIAFLFAVAAGLAVCVLPVAAGHLWKADSEYLGRWGDREFRVYLPKGPAGWVGYYLATVLTGSCCIVLGMALFVAFIMATGGKTCRYCRADIPLFSTTCPNCRSSNP